MINTERLLARVFAVPYAVTSANRPILTMWQMLKTQGRDPLDIAEFPIKAPIAYDEFVRMFTGGRADHLFVGIADPSPAELVTAYFSAPARALGTESLQRAIAAVVDYVRANGFENDSGW